MKVLFFVAVISLSTQVYSKEKQYDKIERINKTDRPEILKKMAIDGEMKLRKSLNANKEMKTKKIDALMAEENAASQLSSILIRAKMKLVSSLNEVNNSAQSVKNDKEVSKTEFCGKVGSALTMIELVQTLNDDLKEKNAEKEKQIALFYLQPMHEGSTISRYSTERNNYDNVHSVSLNIEQIKGELEDSQRTICKRDFHSELSGQQESKDCGASVTNSSLVSSEKLPSNFLNHGDSTFRPRSAATSK